MLFKEHEPLLEFVELLDGIHIHRPHRFQTFRELGHNLLDPVPGDPLTLRSIGNRLGHLRDRLCGGCLVRLCPIRSGLAFSPFAERDKQRVSVRLKGFEIDLVAVGDVVPDILHSHFGLRGFDFDPSAILLNPHELLTGSAECGFNGIGAAVNLRAGSDEGFQLGFPLFLGCLPFGNRNPKRRILGLQRFDSPFVICDIHPALVEKLGKLDHPGGHRAPLAIEVFLLLAFRGHPDADLIEGIGSCALPLAGDLNAHFRVPPRGAASIKSG